MTPETFAMLFFQTVVLGLVLFIAKKILSNGNVHIQSKPIPFEYFDKEKKEICAQIFALNEELKRLQEHITELKIKIEKLESKLEVFCEYHNN